MTPKDNLTPISVSNMGGFSSILKKDKEMGYYSNTKKLITQAVKVLDGEKAYNDANLD